MILYEDTRQQKDKHILKNGMWRINGIYPERIVLPVGDYMLNMDDLPYNAFIADLKGRTSVDTKANILEVANNICGKHNDRFWAECFKARKFGIRLVILIEQEFDTEKLKSWTSPRNRKGEPYSEATGLQIYNSMRVLSSKTKVEWQFVNPEDSFIRILEILQE